MKENIEFLQAFIKNPLKVGAITPSSPELAREMLKGISPDEKNIILELGVGTGAITKLVGEIVPDENSYLGIELDRNLVNSLNIKFPDLNIQRGNACELDKIHKKSGLGKVSYIICCLPFVSMPNDVGEKILSEIEKFMEKGCEAPHFSIRARILYAVGDKIARIYAPPLRQISKKSTHRQKRSAGICADVANQKPLMNFETFTIFRLYNNFKPFR